MIVAFWTLITVLTIGRGAFTPRGLAEGLPPGHILQALLESSVWAVITPAIFWFSHRFGLERDSWARRLLLHVAVAVLVATAFDLFGHLTYLALVTGKQSGYTLMQSFLTFRFVDELIVYLTVLAAGFARDYFMRYQERQAEAVLLRTQAVELQAQLAEARLQTLRMQVNPHFLFNTLHAVSSLVERDPRGVRRMIARLSTLLRYTMERTGEQEVTLQEELDFLGGYVEIQQIRFQGNLDVRREIASDTLDALVPSLILQPLVENAIKHGASRTEETGQIDISTRREAEDLILRVCDNGPGLKGTTPEDAFPFREGVGLRNTRERLLSLYGSAQTLTFETAPNGGLCVQITLPYHTHADLHTALELST